jgi:hypothetical protein
MDLQVPGVPPRRVARWVWRNFRQIGVGYYPAQRFVHIDVREDGDVRWIDRSGDGESHQVRYFMRQADDELPAGAPRLAHDETRRTLELAGVRM